MTTLRLLAALFLSQAIAAANLQLAVRILDPAGRPVTQATVILHAAASPDQTAPTPTNNLFRFSNLSAARYTLTVRSPGFTPQTLALTLTRSQTLKLSLAVEKQTTSITVSSNSTALDTATDSQAGILRLNTQDLTRLPIEDDDVISAVSRMINPSGGAAATVIVDGMVRDDTISLTPSLVKQVRIDNNAYSAEFPKPGKDRIEIDTTAGTNQFHGAFVARFRDAVFDARNPFTTSKPPFLRQGYEGNLNGPLWKKKLYFLISYSRDLQQQQLPVYAVLPTGLFQQNIVAPSSMQLITGRLDWKQSDRQKVSAKYELHIDTAENVGVGGFGLPQTGSSRLHRDYRVELSDQYILSPTLLNLFKFALGTNYERLTPDSSAPSVIVQGAFQSGGSQLDDSRRESRYEFQDTLSATWANINWKAGGDVRLHPNTIFNADNFGGTYQFSSLAAYLARTPTLYTLNAGNPSVAFQQNEYAWFIQGEKQFGSLSLFAGIRDEFQSQLAHRLNLAPRIALAWAPGHSKSTILRIGGGIFYDRRPPIVLSQTLRLNGINTQQFLVENPAYPFTGLPSTLTNTVYQMDTQMSLPRLYQTSATVEQSLGKGFVASADYTYSRGTHLFLTRNINAPLPSTAVRPVPTAGNVDQIETAASSRGSIATLTLRSPPQKPYRFTAQYVFSKLRDNTNDVFAPPPPGSGIAPAIGPTLGLFALPADNYNLRPEWGPANNDITHVFSLQGSYQLPWHFNAGLIALLHSGLPYNITTGLDNNRDTDINDRPPGVTRNTARGAAYSSLDLHLGRTFLFHQFEQNIQCELGVDAFNLFNQTNPTSYVGVITSPLYGQPSAAYPARQIQFSLRVNF